MESLLSDLRLGFKSLSRRPGYATLAIVTLALGIGANSAVYSLVRSVLLAPLPYGEPFRLAIIWKEGKAGGTTWLSASEVAGYGAAVRSFESVGGFLGTNANLTGGGEPERVVAAGVTSNLFRTLGVVPVLGTGFRDIAAGAPAPDEVILSNQLWKRRFGGVNDIVGQSLLVDGTPRTVIGVLPANFALPVEFDESKPTEIFSPLAMDAQALQGWGNRSFIGIARVAAGASVTRATAEMHAAEERWVRQGFIRTSQKLERAAVPLERFVLGDARRVLAILVAAVAAILLIACANVANLTFARADERRRDTAVRTALGASRPQIVRQLVTESLILSVAGATLGAALAMAAVRALVAVNPAGIPRIADVRVDGVVLGVTGLLAVVTGLLFGLWPAIVASRVNLARAITEGGRSSTAGRGRFRFRDALTVAQTASAVVLLIGAMLLVRSLDRMSRVNLGFRPDSVLTARVALPTTNYAGAPQVIAFYEQVVPKLASLPGVTSAGAARLLPLTGTIGDWSITIEGRVNAPNENPNGDWQVVTPGYLETMGVRLVSGRYLAPTDRADTPLAAVLSEAMAARYWPDGDALGKRFHLGNANQPWITVVGVARAVKHNAITEAARTEMYVPHAQWGAAGGGPPRAMTVVLRTAGDPVRVAAPLRTAIRELDPNLPIAEVQTLREVANRALARPRLTAVLLGAFAALALTLAMTGLYGVIALLVARRRQEIGVRIALGAQTGSILRMVIGRGFRLAGAGAVVGVAGAIALTRLLQGMLYGVTSLDPVTYVVVPLVLFAVATLACVVPARRAALLDPLIALRDD